MRALTLAPVVLMALSMLVACGDGPTEPPAGDTVVGSDADDIDGVPEDRDGASEDDGEDPGDVDTGTDDPEGTCADEGEVCVILEDGRSNCCNGRHTCYPEGCYY